MADTTKEAMEEFERATDELKAAVWRAVTPSLERCVEALNRLLTRRRRDAFGRRDG